MISLRQIKLNHVFFLFSALEDFENKIDSFAGSVDSDPDSWISKLYNTVSGASDQEQVDPDGTTEPGQRLRIESVEGLESPILEETWVISDPAVVETGKAF